jgi:hypothetical protein
MGSGDTAFLFSSFSFLYVFVREDGVFGALGSFYDTIPYYTYLKLDS